MKRLIVASTILISMLSGTVFSGTLVGTSYASQTSPPPTSICNPNSPLLKLDSTGAKVIELQRYLVQLGYASLLGQGGIDGKFGLSTQNAVKKFQEDAGLKPVDGIVGPRTWGVLCEVMTSVAAAPIQEEQQQPPIQEEQQQPPIQEEQQQPQGQGGAVKQIPSGQTKPIYNKNRILLGYAGYGGGSLEKNLLQLKASGKVGITNEQIAILKGVASVETGGQVQSINTWDSAVVSFGFMQWTLRYGEFQKLIERAPGAFSEYGIELGGQYKFGNNKPVPGIKGVNDPRNLRFGEWPDRFFAAGKDPRIIEVETMMAIAELNAFMKKLQDKFGSGLSDHFRSPVTVSLLFELNNNRPAYVNKVVIDTLQQSKGKSLSDSDFNNIMKKGIINEYAIRENDGAKGQRLADKIMNTLGVRT